MVSEAKEIQLYMYPSSWAALKASRMDFFEFAGTCTLTSGQELGRNCRHMHRRLTTHVTPSSNSLYMYLQNISTFTEQTKGLMSWLQTTSQYVLWHLTVSSKHIWMMICDHFECGILKVTGCIHVSGRRNRAQLDSAYLKWRNSQTSQLGSVERPRMYTMQTARAVEDPCVHAEIWWSIPMQTSRQIAQQPLTLQAHSTCSRCETVVSSDWQKLFGIISSIREKNLGKPSLRAAFIVKTIV